jgi:CRP/FNR family transcriptional activator FtrB
MTELRPDLKSLPLFRTLSAANPAELPQNAVLHTVTPGTLLFEQGEMPTFQHVLACRPRRLGAFPGTIESGTRGVDRSGGAVGSHHSGRTRIAISDARARPRAVAAQEMIGSLAGQSRRLAPQVENLKLRTRTERAGCYLLALSERQDTPHQAILPYGKIASELGITRESFSRVLSALQVDGVDVRDETITIQDTLRLAATCGLDPLIDDPGGLLQSPNAAPARITQESTTEAIPWMM